MQIQKNPDELIFYSLQSRYEGRDIKIKDMYIDAKKRCTNPDSVNEYLEKLEVDLEILSYFADPDKLSKNRDQTHLVHLLYGIKSIELTYFQRPIITAFREWGTDTNTLELVDCLLKFFFIYRKVGDRGIDILRRIARNITHQIIRGDNLNQVLWTILKDDMGENLY